MRLDNKSISKILPLLKELVECFVAVHTDKEKFEAIKATISAPQNPTADTISIRNHFFEQAGFTFSEISGYLTQKNGQNNFSEMQQVMSLLQTKNIISIGNPIINDVQNLNPVFGLGSGTRYKITEEGVYLAMHGLIENSILGFPYIIEKYKRAIIQVLGNSQHGDAVIGTGFLVKSAGVSKVITCKHNVDQITDLKLVSDGMTIPHNNINYSDLDCVVIDVGAEGLNIEPLPMFLHAEVLSEVITMGYPTIPRSGDAYLMVHKGEINGLVKDYHQKDEYIIFSAKTSSGNSGSPLISKNGAVVGMVTNEFFDQQAYASQGKPPYYAAIPSQAFMSAFGLNLLENIFDNNFVLKLLTTAENKKRLGQING
jgi:S1-C subfamily serine protease